MMGTNKSQLTYYLIHQEDTYQEDERVRILLYAMDT